MFQCIGYALGAFVQYKAYYLLRVGCCCASVALQELIGFISNGLIGNILTLDDKSINGKFTKIILPNGAKGYISSKSIRELTGWYKSIQLTGENVAKTGKLFLGLP